MNVTSWDDVNRIDVRPGRGVVKAWLHNGYEVQVDLGTGRVLQTAYRRSDLIESIHDGSFFGGDWTKLGLFLPTGMTLLLLWLGGLWMFWVPFWAKRKRRSPKAPRRRRVRRREVSYLSSPAPRERRGRRPSSSTGRPRSGSPRHPVRHARLRRLTSSGFSTTMR